MLNLKWQESKIETFFVSSRKRKRKNVKMKKRKMMLCCLPLLIAVLSVAVVNSASATKVFISYGTTQYSTDMGGSSELSVSGDISSYVKSLFDSVGYTSVFDFWGTRDQQTQPNTVYNYAEWATRFRDTTR